MFMRDGFDFRSIQGTNLSLSSPSKMGRRVLHKREDDGLPAWFNFSTHILSTQFYVKYLKVIS